MSNITTIHYRSSYPYSMLFAAGTPVRITERNKIWGMERGKYKGVINAVDGRVTDVTGQFLRVMLTHTPAGARHLLGKCVYFGAKGLVRLPSKRKR